ncbi:hypothetical protein [Streptomyces sp. NBC_01429]|uniref:hypothetical protein n=1 Tax=Streptomyces sp. NBC_01429 TaxID=2903862 RepID=UPI002E2D257E|nr:hypothetical protein [Streptomyces sp. NBC_01429]
MRTRSSRLRNRQARNTLACPTRTSGIRARGRAAAVLRASGAVVPAVLTAVILAGGGGPRAVPSDAVARATVAPATAAPVATVRKLPRLPASVDGGAWRSGHLQGMAVDRRAGHLYFSFTNLLVKTDLRGTPLGSVTGFTGHLGDLDFNERDGRVYGSLEYKAAKAFYIAVFDGERITRMDMDAASTGVVSTVHLGEVVRDYTADMDGNGVFDGDTADTPDHRYGCSGIDGVAFGPALDGAGGERLTVAYGVYANTGREDNDHQVLLQYDVRRWKSYERPLTERAPHTSGPASPDGKYFAYTGNTTYGVQNLEYDRHTGNWLLAVYKGTKTHFPDYSLFVVDGSKRPVDGVVRGQPAPERGRLLSLLPQGLHDAGSGVYGWESAGQYGLVALDDGLYYVAEAGTVRADGVTLQTGRAVLRRWTGNVPNPFAAVAGAS